jgi:hypothetical protein
MAGRGITSAPLVGEARIELLEQTSNVRLDFLKCFYDRHSVTERYFLLGESVRLYELFPVGGFLIDRFNPTNRFKAHFNETVVLVGVGKVGESCVHLHRLYG